MKKRKFIIISVVIAAVAASGIIVAAIIKNNRFDYDAYYARRCAVFEEENKSFESGQIVFIGDSITEGYDLAHYYDLPLKVYNRGIGGDTTKGVIDRLKLSLYAIKPSVVVVLIGINDLNANKSAEYVLDNYRSILENVKQNLPEAEVFVQSVYPVRDIEYRIEKSTDAILKVNSELKPLAQSFGYTYIELFGILEDGEKHLKKNYSKDGLHPNAVAYEAVTAEILKYLLV
ncbi:MAG: GDSL-type esterase/lipase family protein [Clostridiales bacterium]|jgi:lysophospholipase L1-like esterase|nr:GDSL-type esterase/lipase family protein [Clostridiales bacterium]